MANKSKLSGWKAIARYLSRSERTIQLWESDRGLPVHRIPGTTGWTVYAYVEEVDAWMSAVDGGVHDASASPVSVRPDLHEAPVASGRPPGVLVLPFERRCANDGVVDVDGYAEDIIAGLAADLPSLRVLSWTTSRKHRDGVTSMATLSRDLGVRYVIEGSVRHGDDCRRIDLRIIDAEIDRVLIVDRFASSRIDDQRFRSLVVHNVVEHFCLVLAGALVERFHALEVDPEAHTHYLEGVRCFTRGSGDSLRGASIALERTLAIDPAFAPALAMRALVHLEIAALDGPLPRDEVLAIARADAERCKDHRSARVTAAFLDATLAFAFDADRIRAASQFSMALMAMPESVSTSGRLYDRRSSSRPGPRGDDEPRRIGEGVVIQLHGTAPRPTAQPSTLFADVMRAMSQACGNGNGNAPCEANRSRRMSVDALRVLR